MLTQCKFLDFSGGGLGQWAKHNLLGYFEAGQAGAAVRDDVGFAHAVGVAHLDKGAGHLAPSGIRPCHHRGHQDAGVAVKNVFDLQTGDVFAAGDDHVLAAVSNLDVAVWVNHRQVAGVEPACGKGFLRGLRVF